MTTLSGSGSISSVPIIQSDLLHITDRVVPETLYRTLRNLTSITDRTIPATIEIIFAMPDQPDEKGNEKTPPTLPPVFPLQMAQLVGWSSMRALSTFPNADLMTLQVCQCSALWRHCSSRKMNEEVKESTTSSVDTKQLVWGAVYLHGRLRQVASLCIKKILCRILYTGTCYNEILVVRTRARM